MIDFWPELFGSGAGASVQVTLRVVRKSGRPFLLLPDDPQLAAQAMDLYPAQKITARAAKLMLRCALRCNLPLPLARVSSGLVADEPFPKFLASLTERVFPPLALLAGNPGTEGRRFVILLFGADKKPAAVVKAGTRGRAAQLVEAEAEFLKIVPAGTPGVPKLRDTFRSDGVSALALDFFGGDSPRGDDLAPAALLAAWIDASRSVRVDEIPAWRRLAAACRSHELFAKLANRMGGQAVHPAIFHGDFAPWNIKVRGETWTVLDWERGETTGVPLWDWLHFFIQSAILTRGERAGVIAERVQRFLSSQQFSVYAEKSRIAGIGRELVLAYLIHCIKVLQPSEGVAQLRALLASLASRWCFTA